MEGYPIRIWKQGDAFAGDEEDLRLLDDLERQIKKEKL